MKVTNTREEKGSTKEGADEKEEGGVNDMVCDQAVLFLPTSSCTRNMKGTPYACDDTHGQCYFYQHQLSLVI